MGFLVLYLITLLVECAFVLSLEKLEADSLGADARRFVCGCQTVICQRNPAEQLRLNTRSMQLNRANCQLARGKRIPTSTCGPHQTGAAACLTQQALEIFCVTCIRPFMVLGGSINRTQYVLVVQPQCSAESSSMSFNIHRLLKGKRLTGHLPCPTDLRAGWILFDLEAKTHLRLQLAKPAFYPRRILHWTYAKWH